MDIEIIRDEIYDQLVKACDLPDDILHRIEEGIYDACKNSNNVIMHYSIISVKVLQNITNEYVIKCIKDGTWNAESLAKLDKDVLNPEKWQQIQDIRLPKNIVKERKKGVNRCKKCGSWYTTFTQAQTRSADESITTFVKCEDCFARFKFN